MLWAVVALLLKARASGFAVLAIVGAVALWYCTAMIYACIRFIQERAHPLTIVNYITIGMTSGLVTSGALATLVDEQAFAARISDLALGALAIAWFTGSLALHRNARLKPKSRPQSATGIKSARLVQKSMGFTGGSFNTRQFFHGASARALKKSHRSETQ